MYVVGWANDRVVCRPHHRRRGFRCTHRALDRRDSRAFAGLAGLEIERTGFALVATLWWAAVESGVPGLASRLRATFGTRLAAAVPFAAVTTTTTTTTARTARATLAIRTFGSRPFGTALAFRARCVAGALQRRGLHRLLDARRLDRHLRRWLGGRLRRRCRLAARRRSRLLLGRA